MEDVSGFLKILSTGHCYLYIFIHDRMILPLEREGGRNVPKKSEAI